MSSAILYLAIVAIWAFLLVPRWVRRPHTASFVATDHGGAETGLAPAESGTIADDGGADDAGAGTGLDTPGMDASGMDSGGADAAGPDGAAGEAPASRPGFLRAMRFADTPRPQDGWRPQEGDDLDEEELGDQPEPGTAPIAPAIIPGPEAQPVPAGALTASSASPVSVSGAVAPQARPSAHPPISRGKILQARRRLLTILVLLAVSTATCTALKLTSAWVCVPPAGMLGMYLLLLREAAVADAESARRRAAEAHAARQRARERAREAWAAQAPQPTAEIIDISARLGDQLYDQYADATERAVGD